MPYVVKGQLRRTMRAGLLFIVGLAGCGHVADQRLCTLATFQSFVQVDTGGTGWKVAELCIDSDCSPSPRVSDEPRTYAYRLKLRDASGSTIERDGVVSTKPFHVNGEGCDPATANAVLDVDAAGTVTVKYLS